MFAFSQDRTLRRFNGQRRAAWRHSARPRRRHTIRHSSARPRRRGTRRRAAHQSPLVPCVLYGQPPVLTAEC
jgi:hypothetical protein